MREKAHSMARTPPPLCQTQEDADGETADRGYQRRLLAYGSLIAALVTTSILLAHSPWQGNTGLHTIMEVVSTCMAMIIGIIAMLRFYTRKNNTHLYIGTGFLGTALLDGYHSIVTSAFFAQLFPSPPPSLIPWSWNASRTFLAVLMCLSWWGWQREHKRGPRGHHSEVIVYTALAAFAVLSFCFFAFVPLPPAYYPGGMFGRPEEFIAATLFTIALIGYVTKGEWKSEVFEHWCLCSLILGVFSQAVVMSRSAVLFDSMFDLAHVLKILSYTCVFVGLLIDMWHLFYQAEASFKEMAESNMALQQSFVRRSDAEAALRTVNASLEQQARELQRSRAAALNMMRDAEHARRKAEEAELKQRQQAQEATFLNLDLAVEIAERHEAETALRASEQRFRAIFNGAPMGIAQVDLQGRLIESNVALEHILGYTADELHAMTFAELTHPDDRDADMKLYQELMAAQRDSYDMEKRYYRKDGQLVWTRLTVSVVRADAGEPAFAISMVEDITARKQAEEALRTNEERYRIVVEGSLQGISIVSFTHQRLFANQALLKIFGYASMDEYLRHSSMESIAPRERQRLQHYREALRRGEAQQTHYEFEAQRVDGTPLWLERIATRITWDGEAAVLSSVIDITARKQAEAERQRLQQKLIDASRQAGMAEMATGVLHNVGNVLNSINVSANLLVDQLRNSSVASLAKASALINDHAAALGAFVTEDVRGKHLPRFFNQLAHKLQSERESFRHELLSLLRNVRHIKEIVNVQQTYANTSGLREEINVGELVEDALKTIDASLLNHGIELVREVDHVPLLLTDQHKILQILINLLSNAKDAVLQSDRAERCLTLRVFQPTEAHIVVEMEDNGVGIAQNHMAHIFEHGFTTKKGGHGFGLHSSALAAKDLGGGLTVYSDGPGCGARFRLELPLQTEEVDECTETTVANAGS